MLISSGFSGETRQTMLGVNCRSSSFCHFPHLSLRSVPDNGLLKDVLNMSPRLSCQSIPIVESERMLPDQFSPCWDSEKALGSSTISSIPSNGTPTPKMDHSFWFKHLLTFIRNSHNAQREQSSAELKKEISTLEVEIMHLERYLLSLYRTAFEQQLPTFSDNPGTHAQYKTEPPLQVVANQVCYKMEPDMQRGSTGPHDQTSPALGWVSSDNMSYAATPKATSKRVQKKAYSGHRSLADYLGASCIDNNLTTPDRLSEDIVRCISSIYCKFANPPSTHAGSSVTPTSSLSSSSTFSHQNFYNSWSPHCNEEAAMGCPPQVLKEDNGPYATMIKVPKIYLNDDSFNHAASMLQKLRSLVRSLETIDPRKMKREGKLAFWINIHNALVMHAYLAYGTRNHVKSSAILKAAYNVGGHCINAYVIQSSILGIRSHHSSPWLQTLLSPGKKSKLGSVKHIYTIEYPEPLVHFALSSGAYSDPAVRVYTAKNIFQDLKLAKEEFIQASVYIHKESKVILPKILDYFAKDMSLSMDGLLDVVNGCASEVQQKAIKRCMKGRPDKFINWLPQSSTFRYVIHRDLAKGR